MKQEVRKLEYILKESNEIKNFSNKKYMMHKYWGKKPAKELKQFILNYSEQDDLLLDPFAGYGGFSGEAILSNRNIISNDLNPSANFINKCLISTDVDILKLKEMYREIEKNTKELREYWFNVEHNGEVKEIVSSLRDKNGNVIKLKVMKKDRKIFEEISISEKDSKNFRRKEINEVIEDWYPTEDLIINSRISAKKGMSVDDLFDVRSLSSHAKILNIINGFPNSNEKDLLLLSFTSNLANCSKLVPPIKSRGEMSQGAWMTGFYIGETYLENNVFHYFGNRVNKTIKGKEEFLKQYELTSKQSFFKVTNNDAKNLKVESNSIDLVFTDFPYGSTVPYFEQSILWNSWLNLPVEYENEVVISDSKERNKGEQVFEADIKKAIFEIYRVLKSNKYFIFTYHSLSGHEWLSITNSLIEAGFKIEDSELLVQKTFTPRQLNTKRTVKGDMIVICKKNDVKEKTKSFESKTDEKKEIRKILKEILEEKIYETNDVIVRFLKKLFYERLILTDLNIFSELNIIATYDGTGWILNGELPEIK